MKSLNTILIVFPWIALLVISAWYFSTKTTSSDQNEIINNNLILTEIETLGKVELVKYNFKEITELKSLSPEYWKIFKLGPDSEIVLISVGAATGCIDLTKLSENDITNRNDTIYINMPNPELCYFKLDMAKTRIYSLQTNPLLDKKEFIKKAYELAESEIKDAALNTGILDQTRKNADLILKPLFEKISGKVVIFTSHPEPTVIDKLTL